MTRKIVTLALMGASLAISACATVKGAARDVHSVAECTQDMINRGECKG
ncbi:entericidin [Sphingomonas sp.]|nr:entericidin [Sphingomonas sp.]MBA3511651.1 entericidin [Sphingomonas sp.]